MGLGAFRVDGDAARQEIDAAFVDRAGRVSPGPLVRALPLHELELAVERDLGGAP
jgi:hypothetical protein